MKSAHEKNASAQSAKERVPLGVRLTKDQRAWVRKTATERNQTESDVLRNLIQAAMVTPVAPRKRSILDKFAEIAASVPEEIWATLPPDLNSQLDHYVYGTPKK